MLDNEGCVALVNAIVEGAVKDYLRAPPGSRVFREARAFFLSEWFGILTNSDGKTVLRELDARKARGENLWGHS